MKKILIAYLVTICWCQGQAQIGTSDQITGKQKQELYYYRYRTSEPPYGLQKIKALISAIHEGQGRSYSLAEKTYANLSLREKFTYNMIHCESYSQACGVSIDTGHEQNEIKAEFANDPDTHKWSERQMSFFRDNRDSVLELISACIIKSNFAGLNFKRVIVFLNAKQMIPLIISTYNINRHDHDLLTVLMLLMKMNEYDEFVTTQLCKKLYTDDDSDYASNVDFNSENENLILKCANNFNNRFPK